jgi:hypothetical protein
MFRVNRNGTFSGVVNSWRIQDRKKQHVRSSRDNVWVKSARVSYLSLLENEAKIDVDHFPSPFMDQNVAPVAISDAQDMSHDAVDSD